MCVFVGGRGRGGEQTDVELIIKINTLNSKFLSSGSGNESVLIRKL